MTLEAYGLEILSWKGVFRDSSKNNMMKYMYVVVYMNIYNIYYIILLYVCKNMYIYIYMHGECFETSFTKLEKRLQTLESFKIS